MQNINKNTAGLRPVAVGRLGGVVNLGIVDVYLQGCCAGEVGDWVFSSTGLVAVPRRTPGLAELSKY